MHEPPYRLLFIDLDGTCIDESGVISPAVERAVERAAMIGCETVVCTGRSHFTARRGAGRLAAAGHGIVLNGAQTVEWVTGAVVRSVPLAAELASAAVITARDEGLATIAFGVDAEERIVVVDGARPLWDVYARRNADRIRTVDDLAVHMPAPPLSLSVYGTEARVRRVAERWRDELGGPVVAFASPTDYYDSWYAQLTSADADKGAAAADLAAHRGVPRERTMAIGDQVNDVGLLRWAGLGVCMGDGPPSVRECADAVTGSLADDGAAAAIERWVLGRPEDETAPSPK